MNQSEVFQYDKDRENFVSPQMMGKEAINEAIRKARGPEVMTKNHSLLVEDREAFNRELASKIGKKAELSTSREIESWKKPKANPELLSIDGAMKEANLDSVGVTSVNTEIIESQLSTHKDNSKLKAQEIKSPNESKQETDRSRLRSTRLKAESKRQSQITNRTHESGHTSQVKKTVQ